MRDTQYNEILNSLHIETQIKLRLSKPRVNKQRVSIAMINRGSECYDNIIYRSDYVMPALVNYTPRFRTCPSRLLLTPPFAFLTLPFLLLEPVFHWALLSFSCFLSLAIQQIAGAPLGIYRFSTRCCFIYSTFSAYQKGMRRCTEISLDILRGKKTKREVRSKKGRKKNTMIRRAEKNDRVKEWR